MYYKGAWSVYMVDLFPCRYWRHFMQALKIAINSLSITLYLTSVGVSFLLKHATGHYSCNISAPRTTTDASQCMWNGLLKSGNFSAGAKVNLAFSFSKAHYCYSPQIKTPLNWWQMASRCCNSCKMRFKAVIVVCKSEKLLHTLHISGWLPVSDSSHLVTIHTMFAWATCMTQILSGVLPKSHFLI